MKSYKGVKSGQGCEGVTVGALRAVAPAARTVASLVPAGSGCFLGVSCALLPPQHRQSIDTERTTAAMDICVARGASGAHGAGASGG